MYAEKEPQRSQKRPPVVQQRKNNTGLPDQLKAGMESLSGMNLDHVRVHYNSPKPAAVQAHAYAQGSDIHLGPGQAKHLPHELGHVVQQAQGRVKPTTSVNGMAVNDSPSLEREADQMGARAMQMRTVANSVAQRKSKGKQGFGFVDNQREVVVAQRLKGDMESGIGKLPIIVKDLNKVEGKLPQNSEHPGITTSVAQLMLRTLSNSFARVSKAAARYGIRRTITSFAAPTNRDLMFVESLQTGMSVRQANELRTMMSKEELTFRDFEGWLENNRTFDIGRAGPGRFHLTNRYDAASAYSGTSALVEHDHKATSPLPGLPGVILHVDLYVANEEQIRRFSGGHEKMKQNDSDIVGMADRVNIPGVGMNQEGLDVSVSTRAMAEDPLIYLHIKKIEQREFTEEEQQTLLDSRAMRLARQMREKTIGKL